MSENAIELINSYYPDENDNIRKKAEAFEKIEELFYKNNFGSANKSEIELLMFSILMDILIENNSTDNVLDLKSCSDYKIAKLLGIPQEKVRTLKIKKQARYPHKFDWRKSFEMLKDSIVYNQEKNRIIIPMSDPNLYNEIRNFIEENDGYIEIQRGNNVLQMRPEYFFNLLYMGIDVSERKKVRDKFVKKLKEKNEKANQNIFEPQTDAELNMAALELGNDAFDFLIDVIDGISNPLIGIMKGLKVIGKIR